MAQLSNTVKTCQPGTLPSNTIQNTKNDGNCMEVTTQGGKQTIVPLMPSKVGDDMRKDSEVVKNSGELF